MASSLNIVIYLPIYLIYIAVTDLRYSEPVRPGALKKTSPVIASATTAPVVSQDTSNVIVTDMRSPRLGEPPSTANM